MTGCTCSTSLGSNPLCPAHGGHTAATLLHQGRREGAAHAALHGPPTIRARLLHPAARLPTRATDGSAGLDLHACEDVVLHRDHVHIIPTGVAIELEPSWEAQVRGRSGLTVKGIIVHLGTIDSDYRGPIGVMVSYTGPGAKLVSAGDRIAQLVIAPVWTGHLELAEELSATERGAAGFGSTGR